MKQFEAEFARLQAVRRAENARKTEGFAAKEFPSEKWVNASLVRFNYSGRDFYLPPEIDGIYIAQSRLTGLKGDERILAKEIRQAKVLTDKGAFIYLLPKLKDEDGKEVHGPDAIVNGELFEFKTVTGPINKVERNFRKSRSQCENIFIRVMAHSISETMVLSKITRILNDPEYIKGTEGRLLLHLEGTQKTYQFKIDELK